MSITIDFYYRNLNFVLIDDAVYYEIVPSWFENAVGTGVYTYSTYGDDYEAGIAATYAPSAAGLIGSLESSYPFVDFVLGNLIGNIGDLNADKVTKISGKGLSTEDYTTVEKTKLSGIATGATNTSAPVNADWNANSGLAEILNKPTIPTIPSRSYATPSRTSGTAFQISSTRDAAVSYSIPVTSAATLVAGSRATATLQYADNVGMSTNLVTLPGDDFGIGSGVLVTGYGTMKLSGTIPAGKYVRVTAAQATGTPTIGSISAQEVLL